MRLVRDWMVRGPNPDRGVIFHAVQVCPEARKVQYMEYRVFPADKAAGVWC
jgi:hypothetical protein